MRRLYLELRDLTAWAAVLLLLASAILGCQAYLDWIGP